MMNAKSITIPEGNVIKISCNGTILWKNRGLPAGYHLVEYIQSDGSQCIITDYCPSNNSRVVADYQFLTKDVQQRVFSANTDTYYFDMYINGNKKIAFNAGKSNTNKATSVAADTSRHIYEIDLNGITFSDS